MRCVFRAERFECPLGDTHGRFPTGNPTNLIFTHNIYENGNSNIRELISIFFLYRSLELVLVQLGDNFDVRGG